MNTNVRSLLKEDRVKAMDAWVRYANGLGVDGIFPEQISDPVQTLQEDVDKADAAAAASPNDFRAHMRLHLAYALRRDTRLVTCGSVHARRVGLNSGIRQNYEAGRLYLVVAGT